MSIHSAEDYYLAFQCCPKIGPKTFDMVVERFEGNLETAWQVQAAEWLKRGFSPSLIETIQEFKVKFDFDQLKQQLEKHEIHYVTRENSLFPTLLKQISGCPIGLFVKGNFSANDSKALAVVGTRKITPYGRDVTMRFVQELVTLGYTIVSGLARGVDGVAHSTALKTGGRTLAVLGGGLDEVYPPEHKALAAEIVKHGALISEYPPATLPVPGNFPARNRIVSGLSLGVLVTEGASKSGSKITAMTALEQNREVFAVPGPINNPMSSGPGELIQMGAKLVMSIEDVLAELPQTLPNGKVHDAFKERPELHFEDETQQQLWERLSIAICHIDDLVRDIALPTAQVLTALSLMEIAGHVKALGDGQYMAK